VVGFSKHEHSMNLFEVFVKCGIKSHGVER
jgi:hypothetical protein